jgi:hypothetical protein
MSNWTGPLTDQGCMDLKANGYVGVIVQAITGLDGKSYTRQQLATAQRNGLRLAGYVWCFPGASTASIHSRLAMYDGYMLEFLYLDVEQAGLAIADVDRDLAECDRYTGRKAGIYTAHWFFQDQRWLSLTRWADRPLWEALYDGIPDAAVGFHPYGGWTKMAIKQWAGTSSVGVVDQVDLNVTAAA